MVDRITEDALSREKRLDQLQQYQAYLDKLDKTDNKRDAGPVGDMQGHKVQEMPTEKSSIMNIFNNAMKKKE